MTNIVVLIKQVPDTWSERKLTDGDFTLDREAADAVLDEINERAVEEALLIKEKHGGEVTVPSRRARTAPPRRSARRCRWAPTRPSTSTTTALHGSDAIQTAWALAARARHASRAPTWSSPATRPPTARRRGSGHHRRVPGPAAADPRAQADRRRRQGHRRARDRRRRVQPGGNAAGDRLGHREDQRAALPVLQGHHGREEEAGHHACTLADLGVDAGRGRASPTPAPPCVDVDPEARRRPPARRSPTRATAAPRSPRTWSARSSSDSLPLNRPRQTHVGEK